MKKNIILSLLMLIVGMAASAQSVSVEDVTAKTNENASINIVVRGAAAFTAMGFSLELPEGFMVASEMNNDVMNYMINANNEFIDDHTVASFMKSSSNTMRMAVFSEKNKSFKSDDDILLTINVKTNGKAGTYQAKLKSLELANSNNNLIILPEVSFNIIVDGMMGDVNRDGNISVSDVMLQVDIILGVQTDNIDTDIDAVAADMNSDSNISVSDVMTLVDKILNIDDNTLQTLGLCPDDNHPHMIDLGLPSKTKWACCNIEAQAPEKYGDYFAWGETTKKESYDWSTYAHCNGTEESCLNIGETISGTAYDVAHIKWGGRWMMPTVEQAQELLDNCDFEWIEEHRIKGYKLTSQNGVSIFLPASGNCYGSDFISQGDKGIYWLGIPYDENSTARTIAFDKNSFSCEEVQSLSRMYGCNIRPVVTEVSYVPLELSEGTMNVVLGKEAIVEITSGNGSYTVSSSDNNVATALIDGNSVKIIAVGSGTTTITVTDSSTGEYATIEVTVTVPLCPDDNHPHMIDLGLPSGTLWSCCNIDTATPENQSPTNYGGYYAWGETEEKERYWWDSYIHCDGHRDNCHDIGSDISTTQYDVAYVKWGGDWHMPSNDQFCELNDNCTHFMTTIDGVSGHKYTGENGNSIFLPLAGYRSGNDLSYTEEYGRYWTSTVYPSSGRAYCNYLPYDSNTSSGTSHSTRCYGQSVRPVAKIPLQLSESNISLFVGEEYFVRITSGYGSYTVSSSDESVTTAMIVDSSAKVSAIGAGTATITVTDTRTKETATFEVTIRIPLCPDRNHPHMIDLGLPSGTKWACCNVGANTPEENGGYYAWGETSEKDVYNNSTYNYYDGNYMDLGTDISGTQYDVVHVKWGGSWVMPSLEQLNELRDNCTYSWTSVNGKIYGQFTGPNGGTIFFPAAGLRLDDSINHMDKYGFYWISTKASDKYSYELYFNSLHSLSNNVNYRYYGFPVRPVTK